MDALRCFPAVGSAPLLRRRLCGAGAAAALLALAGCGFGVGFGLGLGGPGAAVQTAEELLRMAAAAPPAAEVPMQSGWVEVGGARLWYWDTGGSGEPLVLLHAATGHGDFWEYQRAPFAAAGYRVIGYSRRGHHRSEPSAAGGAPAAAGEAADNGTGPGDLAQLLDALGVRSAHLLGTAAGGGVAADFALSFPERVRSLVIACAIVAVDDAGYMEVGRRLLPAGFDRLPPEFRELGPAYRAANEAGTARWIALAGQNQGRVRQRARSSLTLAALGGLRLPVLLLTGDADLYAPPPQLARLAAAIPGAQARIIDGSGHSAFWEQPEVFNRAVLEFLAAR